MHLNFSLVSFFHHRKLYHVFYVTGVPIPLRSTHIAELKRLKNELLKAVRSKDQSKIEQVEAKITSVEEKARNSPNRKALIGEKI